MRSNHMLVLFFVLLGMSLYAPAQAEDTSACPSFVQTTLQGLGNYCANSPSGSACFGNPEVRTSFVKTTTPPVFSKPGDRINQSLLSDIHTSAIDLKTGKWGIALL